MKKITLERTFFLLSNNYIIWIIIKSWIIEIRLHTNSNFVEFFGVWVITASNKATF
jgi:hypothetical protein